MTPEHARRIAWRRLVEARALKARLDRGDAFQWEPARLASLVHEARTYARIARELDPPMLVAAERPEPPRSRSFQEALKRQEAGR